MVRVVGGSLADFGPNPILNNSPNKNEVSVEEWVKKHISLYWRFWQWFQAELGQTDRKAFYRGWWVLMIITVALLTLSIWFKI